MKKIKIVPLIISAIILAGIISLILYIVKVTRDEYSLTTNEKKWIELNKNVVVDISIMNDLPIFANEGDGVLFSFLEYFSEETGLEFNKQSYSINGDLIESDYVFKILDDDELLTKNDLLFYNDNFVIISKNNEMISNINDIYDSKIGVLIDDVESINNYIDSDYDLVFTTYETINSMFLKFDSNDLEYIIVPKNQFINNIVEKDYYVCYQFGNLFQYFISYITNGMKLNMIVYIQKK